MALRFTLRQMEYLVAVGQCGSIALAAQRLNVSSPTISTAIAQLEADFGLALFLRKHAQGMATTAAGAILIAECDAVLRAAGRLAELAHDLTGRIAGDLNLGCLLTFAQILVPQLRRSFTERYPQVHITQVELHHAALIDGLRNAKLDLALTYDLALPADLEFTAIATLPPFALFGAAHPLARHSTVAVADLAAFPMVLLDLPLSSDYFLSFFNKAGLTPLIAERTRDIAVMQSLVANDFGYSIANIRPMPDHAPDGRPLHLVPLAGPVQPMRLGLLSAAGSSARQTLRAFSAHVQDHLPGIVSPMRP